MKIQVLAVIISVVIFLFVVELIRREKLTFKYAFGWLCVSALGVLSAIFKEYVYKIAYFLGFELPSNFIFFALLTIFVFLSLLLTIFLCQEHRRNTKMAQRLSLIEFEVNELKRKQP